MCDEFEDSYANYRNKTNETETDDEVVQDSFNNSKIHLQGNRRPSISEDIIVSETDSDSDEPIIRNTRKTRLTKKVIDSSSEDDEHYEKLSFSPRTRLSLTGIRPKDLSSDESEIDDSILSPHHGSTSNSNDSFDQSAANSSKSSEQENRSNNLSFNDTKSNRNSSLIFDNSIVNKLSSTAALPKILLTNKSNNYIVEDCSKKSTSVTNITSGNNDRDSSQSKSHDSIELLSLTNQIIELSSDSDGSPSIKASTPNYTKPGINNKNLVQPKISTILQNSPVSNIRRPQFVSKEYYNRESKKLEELKTHLNTLMNLRNIKHELPDGGLKILKQIDTINADIKKQSEILSNLIIEENKVHVSNSNEISWEELKMLTNEVQPKYTGKTGLATFTAQKAITMERLKDIHGSLESCPDETVLAEDPKGLKIVLMDHQKHALAWMQWREKQKPRGGILADDMGLGKTLSMISLILAKKNEEPAESSDEEETLSTKKKQYSKGGTLIVAPASLLKQWESEVEKRTKYGVLNVAVHHGSNRDAKPRHLAKYDMVVTTYNIVARESKDAGVLFGVKWNRLILDEAHVIRNHKAKLSIAVCELKGRYRWALTGTPIQNKELDLYPILKFLKCAPFDDLGHWKRWIDNKSAGGQKRLNTLTKSIMLRRTKIQLQEKGELKCLPEKEIILIDFNLEKEEMNVYQKIMIYSRTLFAQFLHQKIEKNEMLSNNMRPTFTKYNDPNNAYFKVHQKLARLHMNTEVKSHQILVLLLRLRQICCHPGLIDAMLEDEAELSTDESNGEINLLEQLEKMQINENQFSNTSAINSSDENIKDVALSKASSKVLLRSNKVFDMDRLSSKMVKIIETLEEKVLNSDDKAIIVSQWTNVLDILRKHLSRRKISVCVLNGSVAVKNRNDVVTNFNSPNSPERVMLLSLTAGGVGLNLVGANHLFLIDLHWNPQLESQAQDRIYRVGQQKKVFIYKFLCKDTIEERIKMLQDHKIEMANNILTGVRSEVGSKLTIEDLKILFEM